ncbi:hypothetical protein [Gemmatimonas aurantiaca]|uniref:hypothetical protein n=1 Tax=Gemmatimonas aurantiaca TaxID=173480 RepID=UPI00301E0478
MACALLLSGLCAVVIGAEASAQSSAQASRSPPSLALGFAVDTTALPAAWWGIDPARVVLPEVVRFWRDYLAIRRDSSKRAVHWERSGTTGDPDPLPVTAPYLLDGAPLLIEAVPVVAGDASRWLLRTMYVGGGTATRPGLLGLERTIVTGRHEADGTWEWKLLSPESFETAEWRHERIGPIMYVVHPGITFDRRRAESTARWADSLLTRFGLARREPVIYYQTPNLQEGMRISGFEWLPTAERVGGRASPAAGVVVAADPRYGEDYRHELAHVLLAPLVTGRPVFVVEGIAYWLGGARGDDFPGLMRSLASFLADHPTFTPDTILASDGSGVIGSARLPVAASFFELVHRRNGDQGVRRLVEALETTEPTLARLATIMGMSREQVVTEWRALLAEYRR